MSRSPETTTYGISFVSGVALRTLQSCSPPIPLMVRSAKMMSGEFARAFSSAEPPSATTSDSCPFRCSTSEISRATCGSSSTTRILMRSPVEAEMDLLAEMPAGGAGERAQAIRKGVGEGRDAGRQQQLPRRQAESEEEPGGEGEGVRAAPRT